MCCHPTFLTDKPLVAALTIIDHEDSLERELRVQRSAMRVQFQEYVKAEREKMEAEHAAEIDRQADRLELQIRRDLKAKYETKFEEKSQVLEEKVATVTAKGRIIIPLPYKQTYTHGLTMMMFFTYFG